jgi:hypothetical protein
MISSRRLCAAALAVAAAATFTARARAQQDPFPDGAVYSQALADLNTALGGARGVAIESAEIFVSPDAGWSGATTLIANNREHRIGSLFVASDPRRGGSNAISYLVDQSDGVALAFLNPTGNAIVALPNAVTEPLIDASMARWDNQPHCPGPPVVKVADDGSDPDLIDGLVAGNPALIGTPQADITHAGWLPPGFFNALAPNGAASILGVTFTFVFVDGNGDPTDVDRDDTADTAFREIYYNRGFAWSEGPSRPRGVDIESVATHEAGHAFGLGHFGKVFIDNKGRLKFAPRAVMNAVYVSPFADLAGTDNASFCSIWAHRK